MSKAGEFEVLVGDPYPCWVAVTYRGREVLRFHHNEIADLEFALIHKVLTGEPQNMADDNFYEDTEAPGSFNFYKGHEQAVSDIVSERLRQVDGEGWTPGHDDEHELGELACAGAAYALAHDFPNRAREVWPWDAEWWKPGHRRRNLVKAAALIVAEIERLDRAAAKTTT